MRSAVLLALALPLLASASVPGPAPRLHRRSKALPSLSRRALPGPGEGGGVGAVVVGASTIAASAAGAGTGAGTGAGASAGAGAGAAAANNSQTGAAAGSTTTSAGGQASFQPALAGTVPNPKASSGNGTASGSNNGNNGGNNGGNAAQTNGDNNLVVLQFALTLENLEAQFYEQATLVMTPEVLQQAGLSAFQATAVAQQIAVQLIDEQTHVQILQQTIQSLGATPFAGCSFDFSSVLTDPVTFLATARSVELAGVGAYIGGAGLVNNGQVLSAAATILSIEARHQTALNLFSGGSAIGQAFDIGMSPPQVLALAGGFLKGCTASDLGLTANQPLSVIDSLTQSTLFTTGSVLQFQTSAQIKNLDANSLSCQMLTGGAQTAIVMPASSCVVPPNLNGPVAVFLTSDANPLAGNLAKQNASNVVAGPAVIFADINKGEVLQQVFENKALGIKSLPTANLGFIALQPSQGNSQQEGSSSKGDSNSKGDSGSKKGDSSSKGDSSAKSAAVSSNAMNSLGYNAAFDSVAFGATPNAVVQGAVQLQSVNGGDRNVATGQAVGAYVKGWDTRTAGDAKGSRRLR